MGERGLFKHIIWDFDGTLFDTYPVMATAFKMTLEKEGYVESVDDIVKHMRASMSSAMQYYEEKYPLSETFMDEFDLLRLEMENQICKPYPCVDEICRFIHASGRHNYLYTHRGDSAIALLTRHGLQDCFVDFITSKHGFEHKPSPDAVNYLVEKHNMTRAEALMIGDRDMDVLSAKNAGIHACYFTEGSEDSSIADFTINTFQQLYSILS